MKRLARWFLILLIAVFGTAAVHAADASVTHMNFTCTVDSHGNYQATVTAEVNFAAAADEIRLPIGTNVRRISLSGGDYAKKTVDGSVYLVLKNSEGTVGPRTYVITYTKSANVTAASDGTQTLDVELLCPLWDWQVETLDFSVTLPKEFTAEPAYVSGYYGDAIAVESAVDGQTITGTASGLMDRESVDLRLTLPGGYFRLLHQRGGTGLVDLVLIALLSVLGAVYWYLKLRNPQVRRQSRRFSPDGISAWEFPYAAAGGRPDPALLVSEWGTLGYVNIFVDKSGRVNLMACMPMESERRRYEIKAFNALFRRGAVCYGDTPRFRKIGEKAGKHARAYWNRRLFARDSGNPAVLNLCAALIFGLVWFRGADYALPTWALRAALMVPLLVLGVPAGFAVQRAVQALLRREEPNLLPVVLALLATGILAQLGGGWLMALLGLAAQAAAATATLCGGRRTEAGMEMIAQIQAFRRYLKASNTHHLQLMLHQDSQYFYDVLPYAEAMGMGRTFARRFANIQMEPCAWLECEALQNATALEFYEYYRAVVRRMHGKGGRIRIKRHPDGEF